MNYPAKSMGPRVSQTVAASRLNRACALLEFETCIILLPFFEMRATKPSSLVVARQ